MASRDLTKAEQDNVLAYMRFLRVNLGSWRRVERAVPLSHSARVEITAGRCSVTSSMAFRIAKVFSVSLYDILAGTALPPGTCRHCGHPQ